LRARGCFAKEPDGVSLNFWSRFIELVLKASRARGATEHERCSFLEAYKCYSGNAVEFGRAGYFLRVGATSRKQFYWIYGTPVLASPMEGIVSESNVISREGAAAADMSWLVFDICLFRSEGRAGFPTEGGRASY